MTLPPTRSGSRIATGSVTRPADTTAYAIGDLIANSVSAGSVVPISLQTMSQGGILNRARLKVNDAAWKGATVRLHLFKAAPTVTVGDNGILNASETYAFAESEYLGFADIALPQWQTSDGFVKGFAAWQVIFDLMDGSYGIFALLESRTAVTPGSAKTFTIALEIAGD